MSFAGDENEKLEHTHSQHKEKRDERLKIATQLLAAITMSSGAKEQDVFLNDTDWHVDLSIKMADLLISKIDQ